jgi:hypothetical protein
MYVRYGQLFAAHELDRCETLVRERAYTEHWINCLESFGISRHEFHRRREELSAQLGEQASVYDTACVLLDERGERTDELVNSAPCARGSSVALLGNFSQEGDSDG